MILAFVLQTLVALCFLRASSGTETEICTESPVIGVLAQPLQVNGYDKVDYIPASYIKFLEMSGARVVPIVTKRSKEHYLDLAKKLNGLLLPGGDINLEWSDYADVAKIFFDYAVEAMDLRREYFPIYGVCAGLQMLSHLGARNHRVVRTVHGMVNTLSSVEFTEYGKKESKMFSKNPGFMELFETNKLSPHFHNFALLESTFTHNRQLLDMFKVVALGEDSQHQKFVNIMEAKKYPFYGVQFHPERNMFEWSSETVAARGLVGFEATTYFAAFVVQEARKSCNKFSSEWELDPLLIYNFNATYTQRMFEPQHYFTQMYLISN